MILLVNMCFGKHSIVIRIALNHSLWLNLTIIFFYSNIYGAGNLVKLRGRLLEPESGYETIVSH